MGKKVLQKGVLVQIAKSMLTGQTIVFEFPEHLSPIKDNRPKAKVLELKK